MYVLYDEKKNYYTFLSLYPSVIYCTVYICNTILSFHECYCCTIYLYNVGSIPNAYCTVYLKWSTVLGRDGAKHPLHLINTLQYHNFCHLFHTPLTTRTNNKTSQHFSSIGVGCSLLNKVPVPYTVYQLFFLLWWIQ